MAGKVVLSPTRWIVMTGWRKSISLQPFVQTRGSLMYTSISLHPVFQTCLDCGYLFAYTHQSPALPFKHVWMVIPCLSTSICVSNTFGLWLLVCVRASDSSPVFKHVWIMVPCLCTRTSQQPFVSNTFDCGCLFAGLEPKWLRHGSDGDPTPRGVGFRLSVFCCVLMSWRDVQHVYPPAHTIMKMTPELE